MRVILETSADGALSVNQHWDMYFFYPPQIHGVMLG
jgi:hypothetical protein